MIPQNKQCFVIIVHHGATAATREAVESLTRGTSCPQKIIVVDHGGDAVSALASQVVAIVRPSNNGGFGAGINVGLGALISHGARAEDVVIAMNNDVAVYPDTVKTLLAWWLLQRQPLAAGVRCEEDGSVVVGGGHINRLTGRAVLYREPQSSHSLSDSPPLDYIHGAFTAAPYGVLLRAHGFPEQYHLYWEDVLLGRHFRRSHVPLLVAPGVRVKHPRGSHPRPDHLYYLVRNGALFMQQETGWIVRSAWRVINCCRWLYHRCLAGSRHQVVARALADALHGVTGPKPT